MNENTKKAAIDGETTTDANGGENNKPDAQQDRTFTQGEVDRIVGERLARERVKADAELAQREQELETRETRMAAREMITAKGYPAELVDALNCSDLKTFEHSLLVFERAVKTITDSKKPVPDFGGNPRPTNVHSNSAAPVRKAMGLK